MKKGNPFLYEINTVAWLYELSEQYGYPVTLGRVKPEVWDGLHDMGFDYVWFMGVWKRSEAGKALFKNDAEYRAFAGSLSDYSEDDLVGSPYSIAAYEPDPLVGTWQEIDHVRDELHKRNMGLVLDFVPNHTAHDHPWVSSHPERYIQGNRSDYERDPEGFLVREHKGKTLYIAKGRDPFFPPWQDTIQLNYFDDKTHSAIIEELARIADHCDGVRCDMAMLLLRDVFARTWGWAGSDDCSPVDDCEFWTKVRYAVPDIILIVEAYWETEWTLQQLGFDYVYDKRLYDRLIASSPQELYLHLEASVGFQKRLLRFLENHDELRSLNYFGSNKLPAVATLFFTIPGMKLIHHGQMEGKRVRLPVQFRRTIKEYPDSKIKGIYKKIMRIAGHEAFHSEQWVLKEVRPAGDDTNRNFVAYCCRSDNSLKLVVVNLGWNTARGKIALHGEIDADRQYLLFDELNDESYVREGSEMANAGLHIVIEGFRAHVFDVKENKERA